MNTGTGADPVGALARDLVVRLGDAAVSLDAERRREFSRDASWMSPILSRRLPDTIADVVVSPPDIASVVATVGAAHAHRVPITARGRATGNYGQSVPLHGGMILDLTSCSAVRDVEDGWVRADAGASFIALEAAARRTGQELAMFPSTMNSTLCGFVGGGAGGIGSIENGLIWDGFVRDLTVLSCADTPESTVASGDAVFDHLHAYGTTGILTEASVKLVPARDWVAVYATFDRFETAVAAANDLLELDPLPRNLSIDDAGLVSLFPDDEAMPPGGVSLRVLADSSTVTSAERSIVGAGGRVTAVRPDGAGALVSLSYNHVTLRAKRRRPEICHVQAGGPALIEHADTVRDLFGDGLLHLDAHAAGGTIGFGALVISTFVDEADLRSKMQALRDLGVFVVDPHTWLVGGDGLERLVRSAERHDPDGLLNPGKLPR